MDSSQFIVGDDSAEELDGEILGPKVMNLGWQSNSIKEVEANTVLVRAIAKIQGENGMAGRQEDLDGDASQTTETGTVCSL